MSKAALPAFFVPDGDRFAATAHTRGPWSDDHQHAGPPAALLGAAIELRAITDATPHGQSTADEAWHLARITFDILKPIPIASLAVRTRQTRITRRTQLIEATLSVDDTELVRAAALLIRRRDVPVPAVAPPFALPVRPETLPEVTFPFFRNPVGYHTAMDLRMIAGGFGQARSHAWMRMRIPLIAGEEPSPLQRVLVAADSGNGITNVLDLAAFTFMNPDLTVALHRLPDGPWIGLDAYTHPESTGIGLAHSRLHDTSGPLGHAVQTLLIAPR